VVDREGGLGEAELDLDQNGLQTSRTQTPHRRNVARVARGGEHERHEIEQRRLDMRSEQGVGLAVVGPNKIST
jgi:hypothetical protein